MKKLVIGMLAHVDAGKTTLSEGILYSTGTIRNLGRVDHKNAFLDTNHIERERGITIFSKQAVVKTENMEIMLLDTPGHMDFSTEMERTLQVLDYAILVLSATDGVQSHTDVLWKLLEKYNIPTFIFVNKMDINSSGKEEILKNLRKHLSEECVDFSVNLVSCSQEKGKFIDNKHISDEYLNNKDLSVSDLDEMNLDKSEFYDTLAMCDEDLLEEFMENGQISDLSIISKICERKIFPCYFGSALKMEGVKEFIQEFERYTSEIEYGEEFGAKVYKIGRDSNDTRLTYLKITGGTLKVKELLAEEKIDQIRIYSGEKFTAVDEVAAGDICAVTGPKTTYSGQGFGIEGEAEVPVLEPLMTYKLILPDGCDVHRTLLQLRQLEEEDPLLKIVWESSLKEIHFRIMGDIQLEILKRMIKERFDLEVEFDTGNIVYKETILEPVEGIGHFEPLRHYAEAHILLEPLDYGQDMEYRTMCSEDVLDKNRQKQIISHMMEREHPGVLTGSSITNIRMTLLTGKDHVKHTEGGDFRQATYRAIRQGLKKAKSILLEPYYDFRMIIPADNLGRAIADIQQIKGEFEEPEFEGDMAILVGFAPVITLRNYIMEVTTYTKGRGRITCTYKGYYPCHNQEEVIEMTGYNSESDVENPTSSVFCHGGVGEIVTWDKVDASAHVESGIHIVNGKIYYSKNEVISDRNANNAGTAGINNTGLKGIDTSVDNASSKGIDISVNNNSTKCADTSVNNINQKGQKYNYSTSWKEDKELEEIFERTFGNVTRKVSSGRGMGYEINKKSSKSSASKYKATLYKSTEEYLLVDGYNIIFAWDDLRELAKDNLDAARGRLMDILCNYQGFKGINIILVFDAYKVKGGVEKVEKYKNINVIFTKEAETADMYIEKITKEIGKKYKTTVATSDGIEQRIIMGHGALRMSANELLYEINAINKRISEEYLSNNSLR